MSPFGKLLKIARAAVDMVTNNIAQQLSTLEDMVRNPFQAMVNEVTGGIWVGDGANKFVEEVTSMFIPGAAQIVDSCTITTNSITRSLDIMDAADQQVRGLVNDLDGEFAAIF